jgi:flavodoxin
MKQRICSVLFVALCFFPYSFAVMPCAAQQPARAADAAAAVSAQKPLIVWYSRNGHSQFVAESLQKQLGCDSVKIGSGKNRGFFTIAGEQIFGAGDDQEKFSGDLTPYTAVIIAAPIYFMKLSAPARSFMELNREALKGKDLYVFVTLGGKLSDGKVRAIKEYGDGLGLTIKEVFYMQIGKKDEFPQRVSELLKNTPLQAAAAK